MNCWKCSTSLSNIPKLKEHLQMHFDREVAKQKRKRKHEIDLSIDGDSEAVKEDIPKKIQKLE